MMRSLCVSCFVFSVAVLVQVWAHGRLLEPPGRSSMWRLGYKTPINWDDDQLYCGSFSVQWDVNGGKCGVCGDAYNARQPHENEVGGKYAKGIIVRTYTVGQVINTTVELTTNHFGWFEFRVCPHNDFKTESSQECLDKHVLQLADGSGTRYHIPKHTREENVKIKLKLKLPEDVTCFQCFFQWHWNTASDWGICPDGHGAQGCGPQETFRGCADIAIIDNK